VAAKLADAEAEYPNPVIISALTGTGLDQLLHSVDEVLRRRMYHIDVLIPYAHGDLVALAHEHGFLELEEHNEQGTHLVGWLPINLAGRYINYQLSIANS